VPDEPTENDDLEDLEPTADDADEVKGGRQGIIQGDGG
jgi:hypothetical protein